MRIPFFGTDPRQQRIDADAIEIASLTTKLAEAKAALSEEKARSREKGRLASELLSERDAARIERDTAQDERDRYREQLLRFTGPRQRGAHGRFIKPAPNGAQEVRANG